jgi:hypothetical protein
MSGDKKRDCLRLSVCDENIERVLLAQYLRESEAGVTTKCFQAIKGFFHSIAIAECTESTKAQRDAALHLCLTSLSHQMTWLMDYHHRLDGTVVAPGSLSTVMVNGVGWQSPPLAISTGSIASSPPSPPPAAKIAQAIESVPPVEIAWEDIDTQDMTAAEYKAHMAKMPRLNPITFPND